MRAGPNHSSRRCRNRRRRHVPKGRFLSVGGFDELLYPIAYSDTHLAHKLAMRGLKSLYTPYAAGLHHESLSRQAGLLEDFDRSIFLHEQIN